MKMYLLLYLFLGFSLISCASVGKNITSDGFKAKVETNEYKIKGELICLDSNYAHILENYSEKPLLYRYWKVNIDSINNVEILGLENRGWLYGVGFIELLPTLLIASGEKNIYPYLVYSLSYTALNAALFSASSSSDPYYEQNELKLRRKIIIEDLNKYARYPYPLDSIQIKLYLSNFEMFNNEEEED